VVFIEDRTKAEAERAFARGGLASLLPPGTYRFAAALPAAELAASPGSPSFTASMSNRSKKEASEPPKLALPKEVDAVRLEADRGRDRVRPRPRQQTCQ